MSHRSVEKPESSSPKEASWFAFGISAIFELVTSEIIGVSVGTLLVLPFLLIAAALFWLTDQFSPNFASAVAQGKSDLLSYIFGAVAIATLVAIWASKKYGNRRKH